MGGHLLGQVRRRARANSDSRVEAIEAWLQAHPWSYAVCIVAMLACWIGAAALWSDGPSRLRLVGSGLLIIAGGIIEVFLAGPLARWQRAPDSWWPDDLGDMLQQDPNWYRLSGSAIAGFGTGLIAWAVWPHMAGAAGVGIVACLAIWMWTWFAFPSLEDE
jgi:hypothetical protein